MRSNIDAAEMGSFGGYRAKKKLESVILRGEVYVQSRDVFRRIVADIKIN